MTAVAQDQTPATNIDSNAPAGFVATNGPCQGNLNGFMKIPWACSMEDVRKAMKSQAGFVEAITPGALNDLVYTGGKFANLDVRQLQFHFFHGQLESASVVFKPTGNDTKTMNDLREALTQKYGSWFGEPDSPVWKFEDQNTISLDSIGGSLCLLYSDSELESSEKSESTTGINPSGL